MNSSFYFQFDTHEVDADRWLDFDNTSPIAAKALLECFAGAVISAGSKRTVFACLASNDVVIKVQHDVGTQNAMEVALWERFHDTPAAKWLAPVVAASTCNRVIVQRRTTPLTRFPRKMPAFLTDTKRANYGMLEGRVVCHDFGLLGDIHETKMRTVEWWD